MDWGGNMRSKDRKAPEAYVSISFFGKKRVDPADVARYKIASGELKEDRKVDLGGERIKITELTA